MSKENAITPAAFRHLLGIEGLSRDQINYLLDTAEVFTDINRRKIKKVPSLRGKTVINLFLEPSTRTRTSFEIAAKRLSADAVNVSGDSSSVTKGETLIDTARTLEAMAPDVVVIRHSASGAPQLIAEHLSSSAVVNAGDGLHEHPTQALLDALTIKQALGTLSGIKLVLVGDVLRSRVARSNIFLHRVLGNKVVVVAPPTLARPEFEAMGVEVHHHMEPALEGANVVMSLRMKKEYLGQSFVPTLEEYSHKYCITEKLLAKYAPESIVLSPGPFICCTEIESAVIDGPRSYYDAQVENGVAVRMAVIYLLCRGLSARASTESDAGMEDLVDDEIIEELAHAKAG